jgi:hypothetical protein
MMRLRTSSPTSFPDIIMRGLFTDFSTNELHVADALQWIGMERMLLMRTAKSRVYTNHNMELTLQMKLMLGFVLHPRIQTIGLIQPSGS